MPQAFKELINKYLSRKYTFGKQSEKVNYEA